MVLKKKKFYKTEYFNPDNLESLDVFSSRILHLISSRISSNKDIVIICVGTDRATGDALGPIVGSILSSRSRIPVYGTLKTPVHALNLRECIHTIYTTHSDPIVIAIDASLGKPADVGMITLSPAPLYPGIGVNKKLPAIGDISITGIVNLSGKPGLSLLQSTRLYTVSNMSRYIADGLISALSKEI